MNMLTTLPALFVQGGIFIMSLITVLFVTFLAFMVFLIKNHLLIAK